jgi:hypothetical protein
MKDLFLSLFDLKQREVVTVAVQGANIHEMDALPPAGFDFPVELLNYLSPLTCLTMWNPAPCPAPSPQP